MHAEALAFAESHPEDLGNVKKALEKIEKEHLRNRILEQGVRADGRGLDDVRQITCEVGILPRTHGSAVFTRGQTQALVVTTSEPVRMSNGWISWKGKLEELPPSLQLPVLLGG